MNEVELIRACRAGDREAQRELFERTSPRIYRLLLRMTGSEDSAFDLAQATYLRAFQRIYQFDERASVSTWLHRIAVNEALQFFRKSRRSRAELRVVPEHVPDESATSQTDIRIDVRQALSELKPADRAILLLRYQEGLDYGEIARAMNCREGTVASRLNRARARLREILGDSYEFPEEAGASEHQRGVDDVPERARRG
jgi:RNA polymerase sigma-70 factor (ECF subfamily)